MADQPVLQNIDRVSFNILVDGSEIPGVFIVQSLEIVQEANRVAHAKVVLKDGNASEETFTISESGKLEPGAELKLNLGYHQDNETVFEGIIISQGIRVKKNGESELVVKALHAAAKMTVSRKSAYFLDMKDSDIISQILGNYGVAGTVDATNVQHKEIIQYNTTDWDFVLSRAEANGLIIVPNGKKVDVVKPLVSGSAELEVIYGTSIRSVDLELDARTQIPTVKTHAWNMSDLKMENAQSSDPTVNNHGDITGKKLAEVLGESDFLLHSTGPLETDDLTEWANARLLKSRLAKIRGTISFQGSSKAKTNTLLKVTGLGDHFNGDAYMSRIEHRIEDGEWFTHAGIGLSPHWFSETQPDIMLPPGSGLLPGIQGLYNGIVKQIHEDPDGEHRIQVDIPVVEPTGDGVWARMSHFSASNSFGSFFLPEVGDEVILGFINQDPRYPVILGMMYSKAHPAPFEADDINTHKGIVTTQKMKLVFDDDKVNFWIETPGGNKFTISDENKTITLEDSTGNKIEMSESGILIDTPKEMTLKATGAINIESSDAITIKASMDAKMEGMNVTTKAQATMKAEGAMAELKGSAQTTVKGGIVMIN